MAQKKKKGVEPPQDDRVLSRSTAALDRSDAAASTICIATGARHQTPVEQRSCDAALALLIRELARQQLDGIRGTST